MGTSPGCDCATVYYGIYEMMSILWDFNTCLTYYKHYIDFVIGIWICDPNPVTDHLNWKAFNTCLSNYGKLVWDVTPCSDHLQFLDLDILLINWKFSTKLYYKPRNLYLYLVPHSCHPGGVLKDLICGQIQRIYGLTTHCKDIIESIVQFYEVLKDGGCAPETIQSFFLLASENCQSNCSHNTVPDTINEKHTYLHLRYNPNDPSCSDIQSLFRKHVLSPSRKNPLQDILNRDGYKIGTNRLIVCYHRH